MSSKGLYKHARLIDGVASRHHLVSLAHRRCSHCRPASSHAFPVIFFFFDSFLVSIVAIEDFSVLSAVQSLPFTTSHEFGASEC